MATCMLIIPFLCNIGGSTGFFATSAILLLVGFASGACQGTIYAMAAAFPPEYMSAVMFGNGLSGLGSNILRALTLIIWPADKGDNNQFIACLALYIIAFAVLGLCALAQVSLRRSPYSNFYLRQTDSKTAEEVMIDNGMRNPNLF